LRQLSKELNMPYGTLKYHINIFQKYNLIILHSEGKFSRCYIKDKVSIDDKKLLPFLRQKVTRNIILNLLVNVGMSQIEISESLEKHPSTIEFHLKKLLDAQIIQRLSTENGKVVIPRSDNIKVLEYNPLGNEIIYKLKNPIEVYERIITYSKSFKNDIVVDEILHIIKEVVDDKLLEKSPKKIKKLKFKKEIDKKIDNFYKVFPHPYHI